MDTRFLESLLIVIEQGSIAAAARQAQDLFHHRAGDFRHSYPFIPCNALRIKP